MAAVSSPSRFPATASRREASYLLRRRWPTTDCQAMTTRCCGVTGPSSAGSTATTSAAAPSCSPATRRLPFLRTAARHSAPSSRRRRQSCSVVSGSSCVVAAAAYDTCRRTTPSCGCGRSIGRCCSRAGRTSPSSTPPTSSSSTCCCGISSPTRSRASTSCRRLF